MTITAVQVQVPATTANLGPGFDCLAMALDLWNEARIALEGKGFRVEVEGEGAGQLAGNEENLVAQAMMEVYRSQCRDLPAGVHINCRNRIPLGSGLGSSASAVLLGLLGANALLGYPLHRRELLEMAAAMEGHPDNATAGIYGGLVIVVRDGSTWLVRHFEVPPLQAVLVVPESRVSTAAARRAIPREVPLADAVFNLGRVPLVVEALRTGDAGLLGKSMQDRLHQPYRLDLYPGAAAAIQAALKSGAAAAAISGAGPGVIAFATPEPQATGAEMQRAFSSAGAAARTFLLKTTNRGAFTDVLASVQSGMRGA